MCDYLGLIFYTINSGAGYEQKYFKNTNDDVNIGEAIFLRNPGIIKDRKFPRKRA